MSSTRKVVIGAVAGGAIAVAVAIAAGGGAGAAAEPPVRSAQAGLIERFTVRLDARCQVAVLRIGLARSAPVGIVVDDSVAGRVPLGRVATSGARAAATGVSDVKIWDLTLSDGVELGPGRHRVVLRVLSADRRDVLDVSGPVAYTIPRAFARPPTRCGA